MYAGELRVLRQQLSSGARSSVDEQYGPAVRCSGGLLGLRANVSYEGQAAIELEALAAAVHRGRRIRSPWG